MVEFQSTKYHQGCEELFKLLDETRGNWDLSCVKLPSISPSDNFAKGNPNFIDIVKQVEQKVKYELTKSQLSWAVVMLKRTTWAEFQRTTGQSKVKNEPAEVAV